MSLVVAGIHTGIGKTVCSAILSEALAMDYWKPVQSGSLEDSDSRFVECHISRPELTVHPESYRLQKPISPHAAAEEEGIEITLDKIFLPVSERGLIIETAGGILSPLSSELTNLDLIAHFNLPVVLISADYLGSINHSLMSWQVLRSRGIFPLGIVFNGRETASSRSYILRYTGLPLLMAVPEFPNLTAKDIRAFASEISPALKKRVDGLV